MTKGLHVACLSIEPWDEVWRRNQHFAARLPRPSGIDRVTFVNPPRPGFSARATRSHPCDGVEVITPPLVVPRRLGGHHPLGWWTRRAIRGADVLWINDAVAGAHALSRRIPAVYDVTDDWRSFQQPPRDARRIVHAEDLLARRAHTVVCSSTLAERWRQRYGVDPPVIRNGVDVQALRTATPRTLAGTGPHVVYVGTLHRDRLDVALTAALGHAPDIGTVHLVGPDELDDRDRAALDAAGCLRHGPVPYSDVPSWLVAADALICPHLVSAFTLSLDAIKSHEYLATDRPVVATPSSGFENLAAPGLWVMPRDRFLGAVGEAVRSGAHPRPAPPSWDQQATAFAAVLVTAARSAGMGG